MRLLLSRIIITIFLLPIVVLPETASAMTVIYYKNGKVVNTGTAASVQSVPKQQTAAKTVKQTASRQGTQVQSGGANPEFRNLQTVQKYREEVLRLTNAARTSNGLPALRTHPLLQFAAQSYAEDMVKRRFYGHNSPEGKTPSDRIRNTGYGKQLAQTCHCTVARKFGENIARGMTGLRTPSEIVTGWMGSPVHRHNILSADFDEIGIGLWGSDYGRIWVQNFGSARKSP